MVDDSPRFFQCRDLVACVMSFLPWLQYRRWIEETSDKEQTKLIEWRHDVHDETIWENVIDKKNVKAFQCLCKSQNVDWSWIYHHTSSDFLELAFHTAQHRPKLRDFYLDCQPLGHLQVLTKFFVFPVDIQNQLINESFEGHDVKALDWMLNEMHWKATLLQPITWNETLFKIAQQAILAKRLCFYSIAYLPPEMIQTELNTTSLQKRELLFRQHSENLHLASLLWQPEFNFDGLYQFEINLNVRPDWDRVRQHRTWRTVFWNPPPQPMALVDEALTLGQTEFSFALYSHLRTFLKTRSFHQRKWILRRSCTFGLSNIARILWDLSIASERRELMSCWVWSSRSDNIAMFDLAIECMKETDEFQRLIPEWHFDARYFVNLALWRFLIVHRLFQFNHLSELENMHFIAALLAYCPSEFVTLLWNDCKNIFLEHAEDLLDCAFDASNNPLLLFLLTQPDFPVIQKVLHKHIREACEMGIVSAVEHLEDASCVTAICFLASSNVEVTRALVAKNPTFDKQDFLSKLKWWSLYCHKFFFDIDSLCYIASVYNISATEIYFATASKNKTSDLWNDLFARLYCDVDNIDFLK